MKQRALILINLDGTREQYPLGDAFDWQHYDGRIAFPNGKVYDYIGAVEGDLHFKEILNARTSH